MNYRHIYHAGNFSDVFKHIVLAGLVERLLHKDTPFCYVESHAGIGRYDLLSEPTQKSCEYAQGISLLLQQKNVPELAARYLEIVKAINPELKEVRYYPGSPLIVSSFLREQDRMVLAELHPQDAHVLKQEFWRDKRVGVHHMDGYQALKAFLPPKEKRGLVLIDPPYEQMDEVKHIISAMQVALRRWVNGVYAIWYPIKDNALGNRLINGLKKIEAKNVLQIELSVYPVHGLLSLSGCGMIVVNAPWQFDKHIEALLAWLWPVLSADGAGSYSVQQIM